jgi:hypothetical protein
MLMILSLIPFTMCLLQAKPLGFCKWRLIHLRSVMWFENLQMIAFRREYPVESDNAMVTFSLVKLPLLVT